MKLVYLYIEDHKAVSNLQLPISSKHTCNYENGVLFLSYNGNDKIDYYNGVCCSAIIGKNGVGKSTILDFVEAANLDTESSGIIVWFDESNESYHICPINIYIAEGKIISTNSSNIHDSFQSFCRKNKIRLVKSNNLTGIESNDFYTKNKYNKFVHDMSLSQYTNKNKKSAIERTSRLIKYFEKSSFFNSKDKPKVTFTFQLKSSSTSYLKSLLNNELLIEKSKISESDILKLQRYIDDSHQWKDFNESLSESEISNLLFDFNLLSISNQLSKVGIIKKSHKDIIFLLITLSIIDGDMSIDRLYENFNLAQKEDDFLPSELIKQTDAFIIQKKFALIWSKINKISSIINNHRSELSILDSNTISTSNTMLIIALSEAINSLPSLISNNFTYGWSGFSTGEFAKLNIFSELFNYIKDIKNNKFKNHLIIMDEVDLYLHPDWQRTFLSELIDFINKEFNQTNIQIILSTHSPIIVSDFLPEDIISLQREGGETHLVESFGFASNITEMYLQGMHIRSTFGEHSRLAINDLLKKSEKKQLSKNDEELIKKIKSKNIRRMLLNND
ncbi:TPA: AAA family ATPase [Photobacterium damselae]